jgi:hypothetical protein
MTDKGYGKCKISLSFLLNSLLRPGNGDGLRFGTQEVRMRKNFKQICIYVALAGFLCCVFISCSSKSTRDIPPSCSVSPDGWLDFGQAEVCCGTRYKSFTITNTGGATLTGRLSESCDDFSVVSPDTDYSLTAGQSRTFTAEFRPESGGDKICDIETGNALCSDVFCRGRGVSPPPEIAAEKSTSTR